MENANSAVNINLKSSTSLIGILKENLPLKICAMVCKTPRFRMFILWLSNLFQTDVFHTSTFLGDCENILMYTAGGEDK